MKIILCTHGTFSLGIKSSVEVIVGHADNINAVCIMSDSALNEIKSEIRDLITSIKISNNNEPIVLISDIAGGSSTQAIAEFVNTTDNIFGLTGLNLPMLLELSLSTAEVKDTIQNVFFNHSESVINLNEYLGQ